MFKRNVYPFIALLNLLVVGSVAIHLMGGTGPIRPQALWGVLVPRPAEAAGATIYVDTSATGAGTGSNWTNAYPKLQDALSAAVSGDQIWVAAGLYYPDEGGGMTNNDRTATFTLLNGVAVYGGFAGTETSLGQRDWDANVTVLSGDLEQNDTTDPNGVVTDVANIAGNNAYHVLTGGGTGGSAVLDGFTVTAGQANIATPNNSGGGMLNDSSSPTLTNVTFSGNFALQGGGMYNMVSSPRLTNVTFSGNSANASGGGLLNESNSNPILTNVTFMGNSAGGSGGGMFNWLSSNPLLTSVTFISNTAKTGGGMFNFGSNSNPTLTNVAFTGNSATSWGGGMFLNSFTIPVLTNVTFNGNNAQSGGGMFSNNNSSPILTNVLFSGNSATGSGGGMFNAFNNSPALTNVTFSGNFAALDGGGMYNAGGSNPVLTNTLLWNNQAVGSGHQLFNSSSTPVIAYSDIQGSGSSGAGWDTALGTDGGNNIDADPLFVTPVDPATAPTTAGDLHLLAGSPAIDAGDNGACPASDLDGNVRPIDGDLDGVADCDMGAYEAPPPYQLWLPLIMR